MDALAQSYQYEDVGCHSWHKEPALSFKPQYFYFRSTLGHTFGATDEFVFLKQNRAPPLKRRPTTSTAKMEEVQLDDLAPHVAVVLDSSPMLLMRDGTEAAD